MDCSLQGSSVHAILQARILKWVAISFSKGFSRPRDWTQVSCIAGRFFTIWATNAYFSFLRNNAVQTQYSTTAVYKFSSKWNIMISVIFYCHKKNSDRSFSLSQRRILK